MGLDLRPGVVQTIVTAQIDEPPVERDADVVRPSLLWRLLKLAALLFVFLLLLDVTASLLVRPKRVRQRLDARLAAAFGRTVQVDDYSFSLWGGPTLKANGVLVGEDPRFGHEYFLRADSLAVRLRWLSLLRGRFELESLSLSDPTLNVVSDGAGDWNIAEWLGHPPAPAANMVGPVRIPFVPRFRAIEVEDGRIYFKRGDEKLAFAFVDVDGTIQADGPERWRLDLAAVPWRAAEILQQAGTIRLAGSVGGTSSALRPASFELSWTEASLSDFLRLLTGGDSGIRGTLAISMNAQTASTGWAIQGQAQLGQVHRWDLGVRPDVPSLSVAAQLALNIPASTLDITDAAVEGPHSNIHGSGAVSWAESATKQKDFTPVAFEVNSAAIDFGDALSWLRAFRTNIPEGVSVTGLAHVTGNAAGWPLRLSDLKVDTSGAELSTAALRVPVRLGEARVQYDHGALQMLPAAITIGTGTDSAEGSFRIELPAPAKHRSAGAPAYTGLHFSGSAANAGDVVDVASAFGWDIAHGWQIAGPVRCDLRWPQLDWPWKTRPAGTVTIGGTGDDAASLHAPFLNLPVSGLQVRMDLKAGESHATLSSAQAFGAHWSGTFDRNDSAPEWQFALLADRLTTADLDRWLNPRWRESFIDRVLPFLESGSSATAVPEGLRGAGQLTVGDFSAAPFDLQDLSGNLEINGRSVMLDNAKAQVFGGSVDGSVAATLTAIPNYDVRANFSGVDIAALTGRTQAETSTFGGRASGEAEISMSGTARSDFADSLECKGALDVRGANWNGIALIDSLAEVKLVPGDSRFDEASGRFACANGAIALKDVVLTGPPAEIQASGSVDFAQHLALQMRVEPDPASVGPIDFAADATVSAVQVTGTAAAPEFSRAVRASPALRR